MTFAALVSTNSTDNSATFLVDGKRYEYFFALPDVNRRLDFLCREVSPLKALNYARRCAVRTKRLEEA